MYSGGMALTICLERACGMAQIRHLAMTALLALGLLCPGPALADISGVYLGSTPELVELVHIVKTPDGRLAGRIESTTLNKKGEIETNSFTLEGAADGKQVILSAKSLLLHGDVSLTGFVDGDLLDLSWPGGHRTYQRGDSYGYQAAVTGLHASALQIRSRNAADRARNEFAAFSKIANALEANFPDIREQLAGAGEQYQELYKRLHNRRRAAEAYRSLESGGALAYDADRQTHDAESAIWRLDSDFHRLHRELGVKFDKAASYAASIQTYCAETGEGAASLCAEFAARHVALGNVRRDMQGMFDQLSETARTASVDVPPGQRLLKKIFN